MIRKNFSLSAELKKADQKKQQRIQHRQKHEFMMKKLKDANPIGIYERLMAAKRDNKKDKIVALQSEWDFILKHGLHKEKVERYLEGVKRKHEEEEAFRTQNHGPKSVYYNPELNPLGLVPDAKNLSYQLVTSLDNVVKPLKHRTTYEADPLMEKLKIRPPSLEPPRFYKRVNFNTEISVSSDLTKRPKT